MTLSLMMDDEDPTWDYGQESQDCFMTGANLHGEEYRLESGVEFMERGFWETPDNSQSTTDAPADSQDSNSTFSSLDCGLDGFHPFGSCSATLESHGYAKHEVKFENIFNLLNDSMCMLFYDRRPRRMAGAVLSSDTGFPRLPTISPALFSPSYLEVRSQTTRIFACHDTTTLMLIESVCLMSFLSDTHHSAFTAENVLPDKIE